MKKTIDYILIHPLLTSMLTLTAVIFLLMMFDPEALKNGIDQLHNHVQPVLEQLKLRVDELKMIRQQSESFLRFNL